MKLRKELLFLAASALLMTGCVSHKKYNLMRDDYNASQVALAESKANAKSLESMLENARRENQELRRDYQALQNTLDQCIATNQ